MLNGNPTLFLDQYGHRYFAKTLQELREKIGGGRVSKMYADKLDGRTVHVGYVVGPHWCHAFSPVEVRAWP
jgi:hypothetical protein